MAGGSEEHEYCIWQPGYCRPLGGNPIEAQDRKKVVISSAASRDCSWIDREAFLASDIGLPRSAVPSVVAKERENEEGASRVSCCQEPRIESTTRLAWNLLQRHPPLAHPLRHGGGVAMHVRIKAHLLMPVPAADLADWRRQTMPAAKGMQSSQHSE